MKKLFLSLLTVFSVLVLGAGSAFAANGDVCGKIYATDIKTCINGVWVPSYNIGGRTVVAVEDITNQFEYHDDKRALLIYDFAPEYLVSGENQSTKKSGTPVGNIYQTDIKAYFRGKELASYSLNGKTAVAVEDLGLDSKVNFSDLGGRYVWDENTRTLSLESAYRYPYEYRKILSEKGYNVELKEGADGILCAEFARKSLDGGNILCAKEPPDNSMCAVLYDKEVIGYRCRFSNVRYYEGELVWSQTPVDYYTPKFKELILNLDKNVPTAEEWRQYYIGNGADILDELETDEYLFLYLRQATTHGSTQLLEKINKKDGSRTSFGDSFKNVSLHGQKRYENLKIDKENEKVYLHYDFDYVIDLKTDEITVVE